MILRPIDAIFVHPERRLYVVYYRGELWQLPRMKLDMAAWQRRRAYTGSKEALHLSKKQSIHDPLLAQKLRTLDLPIAIRGSTLPRFESWWEVNGYEWLKERLDSDSSPLAAHSEHPVTPPGITDSNINNEKPIPKKPIPKTLAVNTDLNAKHKPTAVTADTQDVDPTDKSANHDNGTINPDTTTESPPHTDVVAVDVFANMLAELADEVTNHRQQ